MRLRVPIFGIIAYLFLSTLLVLLLNYFNQPVVDFQRQAQNTSLLVTFSNEKVESSYGSRSLDVLLQKYHSLRNLSTYCFTPPNLVSRGTTAPKHIRSFARVGTSDISLRENFWEIRVEDLDSQKCVLNQKTVSKLVHSESSLESYNEILQNQWTNLEKLVHTKYLLLETDLIPNSEITVPTPYLLSLGLINGSSLVLLDGQVVGYFHERLESNRLINIRLVPHKKSRLSIVNFGRGYSVPGIAHVQFLGLLRLDSRRTDLFEDTSLRNSKALFTIISLTFLSFILFIFGLLQSHLHRWPIYLAVGLVGFTLSIAIQLDHVQSILNDSNIQVLRNIYIFTVILSMTAISRELAQRLEDAYDILARIFNMRVKGLRISNFNFLDIAFAVGFGPVVMHAGYQYLGEYLRGSPRLYVAQYQFLETILRFCVGYGFVLMGVAALLWSVHKKVKEDAEALRIIGAGRLCFVAGLSFLLYASSYNNFLSQWLVFNKVPTLKMLLSSQTMALFVSLSILALMARTLREQTLMHRVLPDAIKELLKNGTLARERVDRTATEYNWIALNDISKSSAFKLMNLAVVTHALQSVFHKIHKDYLKDTIAWINSIGDAVLLTIKSPFGSRNNDPILEKLVRCYALHVDGVKQFKRSYKAILSVLKIQNHELFLAIDAAKSPNGDEASSVADLGFRTILTVDYYFYGLNHELSNIDSKAVYIVAKAEKLIMSADGSGFIVFPDLMKVLSTCFEEIEKYFERCSIDKER